MAAGTTEFGWSIGFVPTDTAGANDWIEATNVKLELAGPHGRATAFEPEPPEETLHTCNRFCSTNFNVGTVPAQNLGAGLGEWRFPATRPAGAQPDRRHRLFCERGPEHSEQGFEMVAAGDGAAAISDDLGVHWTADARL